MNAVLNSSLGFGEEKGSFIVYNMLYLSHNKV